MGMDSVVWPSVKGFRCSVVLLGLVIYLSKEIESTSVLSDACINSSYVLPLRRRDSSAVVQQYSNQDWRDILIQRANNGRALEIGGPTKFLVGLYDLAWETYDILNLESTIATWKHLYAADNNADIGPGATFYIDGTAKGRLLSPQFSIEHANYTTLIALHTLEHFLDPIGALNFWRRALVDNGLLLLILPWPPATFDKFVPISTIYDLILDHLAANDPQATDDAAVEARARMYAALVDKTNYAYSEIYPPPNVSYAQAALNEPMHHWHVWDFALIEDALQCAGFSLLSLHLVDNWHQLALATKVPLMR